MKMAQLHSNSVVKQGLGAESPFFLLTAVVTNHLLFARDYTSTGDPSVIILSLYWLFLVWLSSLFSLRAREQALCSVGSSRIVWCWGVDCPHPLPPRATRWERVDSCAPEALVGCRPHLVPEGCKECPHQKWCPPPIPGPTPGWPRVFSPSLCLSGMS